MTPKEMEERLDAGEDPLELSIEKWKDIVEGKGFDKGRHNCALCFLYEGEGCKHCPISEHVGCPGCDNTPYSDLGEHLEVCPICDNEGHLCPEGIELAKEELAFLIELRE